MLHCSEPFPLEAYERVVHVKQLPDAFRFHWGPCPGFR